MSSPIAYTLYEVRRVRVVLHKAWVSVTITRDMDANDRSSTIDIEAISKATGDVVALRRLELDGRNMRVVKARAQQLVDDVEAEVEHKVGAGLLEGRT